MVIYKRVRRFLDKFPGTWAFRVKAHSKVVESHINPGEEVLYVFTGQKNQYSISLPNTFVVALTDQRLVLGRKRLLFGAFFYSITPDMFNDLKVNSNLIWGSVVIDTINELVIINNLSKRSLIELETVISDYMMKQKKKYPRIERNK